jgi:hypothetical protein
MNAFIKQIIVALNFPTVISLFIIFAKAIYKAMFNNRNFAASASKVERLGLDIANLDAAETACNTKPPTGSVEVRNVALEAVKADLRSLRNDVQEVADANPANAQAIIASAAMSIKKSTPHGKQQNTAKDGVEEGSVILTGEGSGPHEWRMSYDEKEWIYLPASRSSKTTVTGLVPGTLCYFQNRMILANGEKSEWSQSVKFRVK